MLGRHVPIVNYYTLAPNSQLPSLQLVHKIALCISQHSKTLQHHWWFYSLGSFLISWTHFQLLWHWVWAFDIPPCHPVSKSFSRDSMHLSRTVDTLSHLHIHKSLPEAWDWIRTWGSNPELIREKICMHRCQETHIWNIIHLSTMHKSNSLVRRLTTAG